MTIPKNKQLKHDDSGKEAFGTWQFRTGNSENILKIETSEK